MALSTSLILPRDSFEGLSGTPYGSNTPLTGTPAVPKQFLDTSVGAANFYTRQLTPDIFFGISFTVPWATKSDYPRTAISRYVATSTSLRTYNLNPILAYKVTKDLSIGGGPNLQFYTADFATMVDSTGGKAADPATDVQSRIKAKSFSVGFTVGAEYQATQATRVGVSYRSAIVHKFDGESRLTSDNASALQTVMEGLNLTGSDGAAKFKINTPSIANIGVAHQMTDKLELYGSAMLIGWSRFKDTTVQFSNNFPTVVVDNNWNNSWYLAVGAGYQVTSAVKVRTGIAYDWTPTVTGVRNPRAPNADRVYAGAGFTYQTASTWKLDFSYAHCFFEDAKIALAGGNNIPRGTLNGVAKIDANIFMAQFTGSMTDFKLDLFK